MYGLEKKPKHAFEFDLEKDLKKDPSKVANAVENGRRKNPRD